jgi:large subunit ribosomal protein L13
VPCRGARPAGATTCAGRTDRGVHALGAGRPPRRRSRGPAAAGPSPTSRRCAAGSTAWSGGDHHLGGARGRRRLRRPLLRDRGRYRYRLVDARWPIRSGATTAGTSASPLSVAADACGPAGCRRARLRVVLSEAAPGRTTVRRLDEVAITRPAPGGSTCGSRAPAFCHQQVRSIVGCLVEVGQGLPARLDRRGARARPRRRGPGRPAARADPGAGQLRPRLARPRRRRRADRAATRRLTPDVLRAAGYAVPRGPDVGRAFRSGPPAPVDPRGHGTLPPRGPRPWAARSVSGFSSFRPISRVAYRRAHRPHRARPAPPPARPLATATCRRHPLQVHEDRQMRTYSPSAKDITRDWYVIDAEGRPSAVSRPASRPCCAASTSRPSRPHMDMGDHVIVVNADKIVLTGAKASRSSTTPTPASPAGSSPCRSPRCSTKQPVRSSRRPSRACCPRTSSATPWAASSRSTPGAEHPHAAQQPKPLPDHV